MRGLNPCDIKGTPYIIRTTGTKQSNDRSFCLSDHEALAGAAS
jgi:hypothetical protein